MTDLTIVPIETPSLGDRSYLAHDGEVALVVDPQRDIDRVLALLDEHGVRLTHVFETHLHNDYVTGGLALAQRTGATYLVNGADPVEFDRTPVGDGEVVEVGSRMRVLALATPGHTFTHLSYALADAATGEQVAVFSGGSLLFGATGRPDLLGPEHTDALVRAQHASARRLADTLPDDAAVLPDARLRLVLLGHPVRGHELHDRAREAAEPGADPGRGELRPGPARRAGRLPRLLRAHGARQRGRPLASRTSRRRPRPTRPSCAGGSRRASGSSTCVPAASSPRATSRGR